MIFKDPWVLMLLPALIFLALLLKRREVSSSIRFSSKELLGAPKASVRLVLANNLFYLRIAALALFIVALAGPRIPLEETRVKTEGIDIVLAIDCSTSMLAEDFSVGGVRENRLEAVKGVVKDFIGMRKSDMIGMVAFAARAYTVCPLTLDYDWLIKNLERIKIGAIEDGTAIGSAINSSLNRLKEKKAKSKIIILLTDGMNNAGKVLPLTAAEAAKALGVKIYTIGAGTKGLAPYPVKDIWGRTGYRDVRIDIDEDTLKGIAQKTGGEYYRATDTDSLREIYKKIDELEKTPIEEAGFQEYKELFGRFLIAGILFLLTEIVLSNTILRRLP